MADTFSEQDLASMEGPRAAKEPGSTDWCWQTISALQHMWSSLHLNYAHYMAILEEAEEHLIWDKVPPDKPYGSKDEMLKQVEVGDTKDAQKRMKVQTLAAQAKALQRRGNTNKDSKDLLGLIAKDHPDILLRITNGEFDSVRSAAREAGIPIAQPRKSVTLSDNVDHVADVLIDYYTAEQLARIIEKLSTVEPNPFKPRAS